MYSSLFFSPLTSVYNIVCNNDATTNKEHSAAIKAALTEIQKKPYNDLQADQFIFTVDGIEMLCKVNYNPEKKYHAFGGIIPYRTESDTAGPIYDSNETKVVIAKKIVLTILPHGQSSFKEFNASFAAIPDGQGYYTLEPFKDFKEHQDKLEDAKAAEIRNNKKMLQEREKTEEDNKIRRVKNDS